MKTNKRIFAVVLALVMMLSMATVAFAAGTGTITIKNAANGVTYTFYRVFDMENSADLIYKTNAKWADFVGENGAGTGYVSVDADGIVRAADLNTEADAKMFASLVANAGIAEDLAVTAGTNTDNAIFDASTGILTITGMEHGYYVVKSSRGTIFTVDTLNSDNLEIAEKNDYLPQFKKEVQEDSTSVYGETNDAEIGQAMKFKLTITAAAGQDTYSITDTMANMEFIALESVTINPASDNKSITDITSSATDNTFTITLSDSTRQSLKDILGIL